VMHLTCTDFSTPHGGGGPGSAPLRAKLFLSRFYPSRFWSKTRTVRSTGTMAGRSRLDASAPLRQHRHVYPRPSLYLGERPDGLRQTTEDAVLNANYIRHKLEDLYDLPYKTASMHEVVFSDKRQAAKGVKTGDIAKRLIDYGFHRTRELPADCPRRLDDRADGERIIGRAGPFIEAMRSMRGKWKKRRRL